MSLASPYPATELPQRPVVDAHRIERNQRTESLLRALDDCPPGADRDQLVEEVVLLNIDLSDGIARRYTGRGIDADDLIQVARLALVKAIQRYQPGRGPDFAAFAAPTIRGELKRHFRDHGWTIRPPRRLQELRATVRACQERLEQEMGGTPSVYEVAWCLEVEIADVRACLVAGGGYHPLSLDAPIGEDRQGTMVECVADSLDHYAHVDDLVSLGTAMTALDEREREILFLRFVESLTQEQIGRRLGVSQMQISRLLAGIFARLREAVGGWPEAPYGAKQAPSVQSVASQRG